MLWFAVLIKNELYLRDFTHWFNRLAKSQNKNQNPNTPDSMDVHWQRSDWALCSVINIENRWWLASPVLWPGYVCVEALKQHTLKCGIGILWSVWGEYVYENGDALDTWAWLVWAFKIVLNQEAWSITAIKTWLASFLATLCFVQSVRDHDVFCSIFEVFIMNDSWLNVLDFIWSCDAGVLNKLQHKHVEASKNLFITGQAVTVKP
jgi:hypothetical protein